MITEQKPIRQVAAPTVKSLYRQIEERRQRALKEAPLYRVSLQTAVVKLRDGRTYREVIAGVTRKERRKADVEEPVHVIAGGECSCEDACKARAARINRKCKHAFILDAYLSDFEFDTWADTDPDTSTAEERASENAEALLTAGGRERAARMSEDFSDFDPVISF